MTSCFLNCKLFSKNLDWKSVLGRKSLREEHEELEKGTDERGTWQKHLRGKPTTRDEFCRTDSKRRCQRRGHLRVSWPKAPTTTLILRLVSQTRSSRIFFSFRPCEIATKIEPACEMIHIDTIDAKFSYRLRSFVLAESKL